MCTTVITGFHQDAEGDWIADLACGHSQHVRHRPPWQSRPWVTSEAGRAEKLGASIDCPLCKMPEAPVGVGEYKRTATFTQSSVPIGLLRDHRTKPGVWARIVIEAGGSRVHAGLASPHVRADTRMSGNRTAGRRASREGGPRRLLPCRVSSPRRGVISRPVPAKRKVSRRFAASFSSGARLYGRRLDMDTQDSDRVRGQVRTAYAKVAKGADGCSVGCAARRALGASPWATRKRTSQACPRDPTSGSDVEIRRRSPRCTRAGRSCSGSGGGARVRQLPGARASRPGGRRVDIVYRHSGDNTKARATPTASTPDAAWDVQSVGTRDR